MNEVAAEGVPEVGVVGGRDVGAVGGGQGMGRDVDVGGTRQVVAGVASGVSVDVDAGAGEGTEGVSLVWMEARDVPVHEMIIRLRYVL